MLANNWLKWETISSFHDQNLAVSPLCICNSSFVFIKNDMRPPSVSRERRMWVIWQFNGVEKYEKVIVKRGESKLPPKPNRIIKGHL